MKILGIETSCDETGAAIIEANSPVSIILKSNTLASSLSLHAKTGGVIPEIAARQQLHYMIPVLDETLKKAGYSAFDIDAIAVTYGPGLIGSLLVGVETAKTLAYIYNKPLIPVNHLLGHIYANWIGQEKEIRLPAIGLIVSGGHTDILLLKSHTDILLIGGTRDDAAGEAFDKIGRLLGMPYPAGPHIEAAAKKGNPKKILFPKPMIHSNTFEFSFSGLKTAVLREIKKYPTLTEETINDISTSVQQSIIDVLVAKTIQAVKAYNVSTILMGGGVSANTLLGESLRRSLKTYDENISLYIPKKQFCTDNASMIAAAAFFQNKPVDLNNVSANPELYF
ncbi:MAG: tRNA (adenosine(37)-N6)-threonylcarbamoyltransferase complex transferase subunit TsaD [Candidatus Levybacteria bacterium]|nr:tRNA (adenosine(37)-N6)-threonylcarbamoyltransferase complex transferase subunit TsaD [Candidatus Levybacteria bacterium]